MKREYKLEGLDCGNCATKIEQKIRKLNKVKEATVNFLTKKMIVEITNDCTNIDQEVIDLIDKIEPSIKVIAKQKQTEEKKKDWSGIILLTVIFFFLLGFFLPFPNSAWSLTYYFPLYLLVGYRVLLNMFKNVQHGNFFDENFLMSLATIGAFFLGEFPEAIAVMLFYQVGEYFQDKATQESRNSIAALVAIRPDYAWKKVETGFVKSDPEQIQIGDLILVKPGEKVPLDGLVLEGISNLDTSALTGESLPRAINEKQEIMSGVINLTSPLTIEVTKTFENSTASKILDLVENASNHKADTERMITRFSRLYTPIIVLLALVLAVVPPMLGLGDWSVWLYRALTFLVISCPCALAVSVPMSFFGGLGASSKLGVLIKGSNYLEVLAKLEGIAFDKTGTITQGSFAVDEIVSVGALTSEEILKIATHVEEHSQHPIAQSIRQAYQGSYDENAVTGLKDISGKGLSASYKRQAILLGNKKLMAENQVEIPSISTSKTLLYLAVEGHYQAYITISDQIKDTSQEALENLENIGIKKRVLLSGDRQSVVDDLAETLHFTEAYGDCLPQDKLEKFESLLAHTKGSFAFVGDGINDAPVLARADVGIAMGALGTDAAIEAADVVIMDDDLHKLPQAVSLARKTLKIAQQNISLAIVVKFIFLGLTSLGLSNMWEAIFADVGVTLLAVGNALRILRVKTT